jgi:hypothetical protein
MKTTSLLIGTFLTLLAGGCMSDNYGPASPDYYPNASPPYVWNSRPAVPARAKATPAALQTPANQMARQLDVPLPVRS